MSRSRRKIPVCSICCCDSEKEDKRIWHRRMRLMSRHQLLEPDRDAVLIPLTNEVGNVWEMRKDGKTRFDPREHPEWMRK